MDDGAKVSLRFDFRVRLRPERLGLEFRING